ncbi:hypothetical protein SAMN05660733_00088 [Lentzea albidocapillata]|uniref:Uncharacterized protein n=1 Tax=Lentzea albidocapillata TaxID=40571 RepID=A0A1W1ZL94_9PSEU|nr:hypothetical protein SAMN05660733_00088 [Lentzea albidocapillata]
MSGVPQGVVRLAGGVQAVLLNRFKSRTSGTSGLDLSGIWSGTAAGRWCPEATSTVQRRQCHLWSAETDDLSNGVEIAVELRVWLSLTYQEITRAQVRLRPTEPYTMDDRPDSSAVPPPVRPVPLLQVCGEPDVLITQGFRDYLCDLSRAHRLEVGVVVAEARRPRGLGCRRRCSGRTSASCRGCGSTSPRPLHPRRRAPALGEENQRLSRTTVVLSVPAGPLAGARYGVIAGLLTVPSRRRARTSSAAACPRSVRMASARCQCSCAAAGSPDSPCRSPRCSRLIDS